MKFFPQEPLTALKGKKHAVFVGLIAFFSLWAVIFVFIYTRDLRIAREPVRQKRDWQYELFAAPPAYRAVDAIVAKSVSQSAAIAINLPPDLGVSTDEAKTAVAFTPAIAGEWQAGAEDKLVYRPQDKLVVGNYYTVTLALSDGTIGADFVVEDDPAVLNVFPKAGSETHENSEITILFNRPMVPLSSLDIMAPDDIPVEITPATAGRFKWIGTRSLKFIPDSALVRSANYSVKIKPDFQSMDGLGIAGFDHQFSTRHLRYESVSQGSLIYDAPIRVKFNMPVDLDKTKDHIWMKDTDKNQRIDFIAEYAIKKIYDPEKKAWNDFEDQSELWIYNKADRYGREKLWDFGGHYFLMVEKAVPSEGDIILTESRQAQYQATGIIESIGAESEQSKWVDKDLFDASGKLTIKFYEDIDLAGSRITGDRLADIEYGEKCKDDGGGLVMYGSADCEKETDHSLLLLAFDQDKIKRGDVLKLNLEKIVNSEGFTINTEPIEETIRVIPELKVLSTEPADGSSNASLTDFYLCTNLPLVVPAKEDIDAYLEVNLPYNYSDWGQSYRVPDSADSYWKCRPGEFRTQIFYGLAPESDYRLKFDLQDEFGGELEKTIAVRTAAMSDFFLNFYHLQDKVLLTTPDKTKLTFAAENMDYVDMDICRLDAEAMVRLLSGKPDYWAGPDTIKNCRERIKKRIDLPKLYWAKNYFQVDLKDYVPDTKGHWLITFSNPHYIEYYGDKRPVYERVYLTVSNIGITEKKIDIGTIENTDMAELKNIFWITDLKTLAPVSGAAIRIFNRITNDSLEESGTVVTDSRGIAEYQAAGQPQALIVAAGDDSAVMANNDSTLEYAARAGSSARIYAYTDRPIYRPGQEVHIKGIYRIGYDNDYEIFADRKVEVVVRDSRYMEISKQSVAVNDFGTFALDLELPPDAALGTYSVRTDNSNSNFDVEEYVPAAFKVDVTSRQEEYISRDTVTLDIDASYYFGAPVEGGEVEYAIGSQDYHFDRYSDPNFRFGSDWYRCYWDCSYNDKFILRNTAKLGADGKATISHKLDLSEIFKDEEEAMSKIIVVYVTVKNSSGQSVSAQQSFIMHRGEYYLGISAAKRFLGEGEKFDLKLKSVDTKGNNSPDRKIELSISRIEWKSVKRKEVDGGYYYRWEETLMPAVNDSVTTDKNGDFKKEYALQDSGEYKVVVKGSDSRGNEIRNSYYLYVYGSGQADVRPTNDHTLEIEAGQSAYQTGDTAEVIIKSPFEKGKALISLERGRVFHYDIVDVDQGLYRYQFPVTEDYIPNIFVSATLLSGEPDIKYGSTQLMVDTDRKEITIDVSTEKDHYLPGEEVNLSLYAYDADKRPVEADISVAVADLSVLALKGNPKKNPVVFFYSGFPLTVMTASNMKNILFETDVPTGTKGGGGAEAEDLAKKKRGIFKDTALWEAFVRTDKSGRASLHFTLPDNLTTWQVEALGVTRDTRLGVEYAEFVARKDLMLTPLVPRFIVPGDEFAVGAKIFNQTKEAQDLDVSLAETGLALVDDAKAAIRIPAGASDTVYFRVKAPADTDEGGYGFTLSAGNKAVEDTVAGSVQIRPNDTYETTATAGYSRDTEVNEYVYLPESVLPDKGGLSITTSATLAVFLSDALNSLLDYPYGCSEQIASKLDAIAIIKRGLNLENIGDKFVPDKVEYDGQKYTIDELVAIGLADIYKDQDTGGGFRYYPGSGTASFYLSLHIADTLRNLEAAGYPVDEAVFGRLFNYLQKQIVYEQYPRLGNEDYIYAARTLYSLKDKWPVNAAIGKRIAAILNNDKYLNEDIGSLALANLALMLSENPGIFGNNYLNRALDNLENRIEIDSRGAFLPQGDTWSWFYYETPVRDSAMLLKALVSAERDNNILDRVLRWLLNSRYKDGAWGSTNNTLGAVDALVDYIKWQNENKSNFTLSVNFNQATLKNMTFGPGNIFEQSRLEMSVPEIGLGQLDRISFAKENLNEENNNFYYDLALRYYLPAESLPPRDEGFVIERGFYRVSDKEYAEPVASAAVGDVLRGHLKISVPKQRNFVSVEDFIPAGVEIVNFNLDTENAAAVQDYSGEMADSDFIDAGSAADYYNDYYNPWYYSWRDSHKLYPDFTESHDDRVFLYKERLAPGEYEYDYFVRALVPGRFQWLPARIQEMYFPENFGRTGGGIFVVNEKKTEI